MGTQPQTNPHMVVLNTISCPLQPTRRHWHYVDHDTNTGWWDREGDDVGITIRRSAFLPQPKVKDRVCNSNHEGATRQLLTSAFRLPNMSGPLSVLKETGKNYTLRLISYLPDEEQTELLRNKKRNHWWSGQHRVSVVCKSFLVSPLS